MMKILTSLIILTLPCLTIIGAETKKQLHSGLNSLSLKEKETLKIEEHEICAHCDSLRKLKEDIAVMISEIRPDSAITEYYSSHPLPLNQPLIFKGYRPLINPFSSLKFLSYEEMMKKLYKPVVSNIPDLMPRQEDLSVGEDDGKINVDEFSELISTGNDQDNQREQLETYESFRLIPEWLSTAEKARRIYEDVEYRFMINNPSYIYNAYWDLPVPPRLPEDDKTFLGYLSSLQLPSVDPANAYIPEFKEERRYWLHFFNTGLQFSQAYISSNWYQGGNNYLALLFNFVWNVDLNTVYHPNLLFQSALSYKLGINSNPKGSMHPYSISQDNFLYSLKTGFKAFNHWFYSLNLQLNTPIFNAYPSDSNNRSGAFLSPGTLNVGLGMTYTTQNPKKTFKLSASIAPLAYNLKTCIASDIDASQFNIQPGRKTNSEIGSNAEINMTWNLTDNISWTSRMFLFSDYSYFLADWENTFNFNINKFLSTQLYLHPRFDSSSEFNSSKWHYWMFKEILSFGLSYTFSTKQ